MADGVTGSFPGAAGVGGAPDDADSVVMAVITSGG